MLELNRYEGESITIGDDVRVTLESLNGRRESASPHHVTYQ